MTQPHGVGAYLCGCACVQAPAVALAPRGWGKWLGLTQLHLVTGRPQASCDFIALLTCQAKQPVLGANILQSVWGRGPEQETQQPDCSPVCPCRSPRPACTSTASRASPSPSPISTPLAWFPGGWEVAPHIDSSVISTSPRLAHIGYKPCTQRGKAASPTHFPTAQKPFCFHHDCLVLQHVSPARSLSKHNREPLLTSWAPARSAALPRPRPPRPRPHLPFGVSCPIYACLLICPRVYLCLFSRLSVCSGGFTRAEVLTERGCGEDTPCPLFEPYLENEVTAQGSGWNFAPDDLAQFAGASPGTAGVRPSRKQAPPYWLLLLPPHPPSPQPAASSRASPQRAEGRPFPRHLQKQGSGCAHQPLRGKGSGGGAGHGQPASWRQQGPHEETPRS